MTLSIFVELGLTPTSGAFIIGTSLLAPTGTDVLTDGYNWTDVSSSIVDGSLSWSRGATRSQGPWFRYEAGHASLVLDNNAGDVFSPLNLSGPYTLAGASLLHPGIPIRIRIDVNGFGGTVFRGWVDTWQPASHADKWSTVSVTATDGVERLQAANPPALANPIGAGENAGARIKRILDNVHWPSDMRNIDMTGDITMQGTTLSQPAWTEMTLVSDSAAGFLFLSMDGKVTYYERSKIPASVSYVLGPSGYGVTDIGEDIALSYDRTQVLNQVSIARAGGTAQTVEDVTSSSDSVNGIRSYARSDLVCETDANCQAIAQYLVYYYGNLRYRVESVTIPLLPGSATLESVWLVCAWYFEMATRIAISVPQPNDATIYQQVLVRGISWSIGLGKQATVTLSLQQTPTAYDPFTLNSSLIGGAQVLAPF